MSMILKAYNRKCAQKILFFEPESTKTKLKPKLILINIKF